MTRLRALWSGDLPLDEAFWTYAVGVGLAVNVITSLLFLVLISWDRPFAALFVGYALSVPYNVIALVGVWRSAARYQGERVHAAERQPLAIAAPRAEEHFPDLVPGRIKHASSAGIRTARGSGIAGSPACARGTRSARAG